MKIKTLFKSTAARLIIAIVIGIVLGLIIAPLTGTAKTVFVQVFLIIKQITSQIIFFMVPLIIIGCVAPSIASFKGNATKLLFMTIGIAYLSSILAAMVSIGISFLAVMTAIYTIQDGFGTACNITCDGALTLITETYLKRIKKP